MISKFSYDITISNSKKIKVNEDSLEIVFTDWIKEKQMENKVTKVTFASEGITIKGYVIFDSKGLDKEEIINHQPFIDGIGLTTDEGDKIKIPIPLKKKDRFSFNKRVLSFN